MDNKENYFLKQKAFYDFQYGKLYLVGLAGAPLPEDKDQLDIPPTKNVHKRKYNSHTHKYQVSSITHLPL